MLKAMVLRNIKLYFKDKGMFFTSLITPAILLVLYATFLGSVYRDSFTANLPDGFSLSQKLIDGAVGAQLISCTMKTPSLTGGSKSLKLWVEKNNLQSYNKVKVCQPNNKKQRRYRHEKRRYK